MVPSRLDPGTIVAGPFYDDDDRARGAGVIVARGRELWTRVPDDYVPVRVIVGNRCNGGYRPASLRAVSELRLRKATR